MGSFSSLPAAVGCGLLIWGAISWAPIEGVAKAAPAEPAAVDAQPVQGQDRDPLVHFLPTTGSAALSDAPVTTGAWGGYDGAARAPVAAVAAEVRIVGPVALMVGASYTEAADASPAVRMKVGLRAQFLRQERAGVDASASLQYRRDRFIGEDGLFQAGLAIGRSFGSVQAVANVLYGQDGEGDDRVGEARLAIFRPIGGGFHLGGEGRYAHSLGSTDPLRVSRGNPSMEAMAGPVLAYTAGRLVLVAEAGATTTRIAVQQTGFVGVAGVGTTF